MKKGLAILLLLAFLLPIPVLAQGGEGTEADDETVFDIVDEQGERITYFCGTPEAGDEYISGDNQQYRITSVDAKAKRAVAESLGVFELPDVSWLDADATLPVSASGDKKIALYCTHSDESYVPTDGSSTKNTNAGIFDVAGGLVKELEAKGVTVEYSTATHLPHDAGAYRRSRQTAMKLLQNTPNAIFDIHRDGIPDPSEYNIKLGGESSSKVRLEVGRSNQNSSANKNFAAQIKAVADKIYPGLVKDIFIGKGTYNQDLLPHSVLLEFGTHTTSKDRAINSTKAMADVLYKTLYGGVSGAAGSASDVKPGNSSAGTAAGTQTNTPSTESDAGSGSGILWVVGVFVAGLIIFALIATGSKQGTMDKLKRGASEMTGGLFGKKPQKK